LNNNHSYFLIIGFLVLVVLISGCISFSNPNTSQNAIKNFTFNGFSFDYPSNWHVTVSDDDTGPSIIVSKDYHTQLQVMITPNYGMSEEGVLKERNKTVYPSWKKISEDTLILDNQTAYRIIFSGNDIVYFFKDMRYEEVVFVKNNSTFTILTTVPSENYNDEKQSFETILDSIHVQSVI